MQAQVAFQQADYVAWNLWASINRRPLLPFKYQHLGEMMSLGRARGAVTLPVPLAPPLRQALNGGVIGSLLSLSGIKCVHIPHPQPLLFFLFFRLPSSSYGCSNSCLHAYMPQIHVVHY